ncbi:MAG: hypothetical protein SOZ52_05990 [Pyramidobacter sp.]|nr:hypothetical protein [Pyramidobacter sp.]
MMKKIFNLAALGVLGVVIFRWARGKRLNPVGLRLLLALLTALALMFESSLIVIFAGSSLAFLLLSDAARLFGYELRLFDELPKKNAEPREPERQFSGWFRSALHGLKR